MPETPPNPRPFARQLATRYEVEREIGAGGMATVYLARDLKHNRKVALKVLRPELGAVLGPERFLSEIQVTANLQHPNLLALFDSGEVDGQLFYVMPFVEGESLRARLDRERQLPIDVALHIATSVASALDYAHRHGVIHRDLKPENILMHEGEPLVADFGIALAVSNAGGNRITQTGLSLGTPQYMSPEQATGDRVIDARSDIYSLGSVTYEMLAGEPPHTGSSSQAIIARLLTERPRSLRATRPSVPEHVERATLHALEKLPADRFGSAREFADALTGKAVVPMRTVEYAAVELLPPAAARARPYRRLGAAAGVAGAVVLGWWAGATQLIGGPAEPESIRFEVATPDAHPLQFSISPDGRFLVVVGPDETGEEDVLWVRALGETTPRALPGTEGAAHPFWSADSEHIGYAAEVALAGGSAFSLRLEVVDVAGGSPRQILDLGDVIFQGGTWNADGVIVYSAGRTLHSVAETGGTPTELTTIDNGPQEGGAPGARRGDGPGARRGNGPGRGRVGGPGGGRAAGVGGPETHTFPVFLPDGRRFLFLGWDADAERAIMAGSLDGDEPVLVMKVNSKPVFAAPRTLIFAREGSLFAQELDMRSLGPRGEPTLLEEGVGRNLVNGLGAFSASSDGVLVFRSSVEVEVERPGRQLAWFGRDGRSLGAVGEAAPYEQSRLSPDGRTVALARNPPTGRGRDIWTLDLASNIQSRLTLDSIVNTDPIWFPDSRELAFISFEGRQTGFYRKVLGASSEALIQETNADEYIDDVSGDGRFLLYHTDNQLIALSLAGGARAAASDSVSNKDSARFSPDGSWISYGSLESDQWEVFVTSFPDFQNKRQVSLGGGMQARWRADGRELLYLSPDGTVMSVPVSPGTAPTFSAPAALFQSPLADPDPLRDTFDATRDGQRFLLLVPEQVTDSLPPITVVVNWRNSGRGAPGP